MDRTPWLAATLTAALVALAGCVEDESTEDDANARQFTAELPAGATQIHVDVAGRATAGEPDVTVLVENEAGANLASDTWSVGGSPQRRVSADVDGETRVLVTVRVVDGDAELDVRVSATVPSQPEPVVIVQERVVIVTFVPTTPPVSSTPPVTTSPTPPSATPTPTSPTPPSPTPTPPTNATNATPTDNTTNATA